MLQWILIIGFVLWALAGGMFNWWAVLLIVLFIYFASN